MKSWTNRLRTRIALAIYPRIGGGAGTSPEQAAADWASRLGASGEKITRGVQSVTTSPGQAAARQAAVWLQNTQAAAQKFARNSAAVPLGEWQQAMIEKGIPRVGAGASAAQAKFASFMAKLLPAIATAKASLPPRGNYEQNKARANAMMDALHKQSFK